MESSVQEFNYRVSSEVNTCGKEGKIRKLEWADGEVELSACGHNTASATLWGDLKLR